MTLTPTRSYYIVTMVGPILELGMTGKSSQTISGRIKAKLEEAILNREYGPGDRLPAERELQDKEGVGRGTVREAYRSLQNMGLIEIRRGGGAFVAEVDSSQVGGTMAALIRHGRVSTRHVQEFREAVESRCAAYAAERATEDQIDRLKSLIDQMEARYRSSGQGDSQFYKMELNLHTELAKISGNPMFEWFANTFQHNAYRFSNVLIQQAERPEEALTDWRDFILAVENREVTKAAMIIGAHIFRFGKILESPDLNQRG